MWEHIYSLLDLVLILPWLTDVIPHFQYIALIIFSILSWLNQTFSFQILFVILFLIFLYFQFNVSLLFFLLSVCPILLSIFFISSLVFFDRAARHHHQLIIEIIKVPAENDMVYLIHTSWLMITAVMVPCKWHHRPNWYGNRC